MKVFSTIRFVLTLRCEESMRLVSAGLDRRLDVTERMALWGHLLVCRACRIARKQLKYLKEMLQEKAIANIESAGLSEDAKQRMNLAISNRLERPKG